MAVVIRDACGAWSSCNEEEQNLILNHITLHLPRGLFVAVVGEVKFLAAHFSLFLKFLPFFSSKFCGNISFIAIDLT